MPTVDHTYCILLGKNQTGNDQKSKIEPGQVHTESDCADTFTFKCNNEMQQENFGDSRNPSMEGCLLHPFTERAMELCSEGRLENVTEKGKECVFNCHLSGDTAQNAATTHVTVTHNLGPTNSVPMFCLSIHFLRFQARGSVP